MKTEHSFPYCTGNGKFSIVKSKNIQGAKNKIRRMLKKSKERKGSILLYDYTNLLSEKIYILECKYTNKTQTTDFNMIYNKKWKSLN